MSFEFRLRLFTMFRNARGGVTTQIIPYVVRAPIATTATEDARRVLEHYRKVLTGEVLANGGFYPSRIRIGLVGAAVRSARLRRESL
jgi:hypothetical protein